MHHISHQLKSPITYNIKVTPALGNTFLPIKKKPAKFMNISSHPYHLTEQEVKACYSVPWEDHKDIVFKKGKHFYADILWVIPSWENKNN